MGRIDYSLYLVTDRALARGRPLADVVRAAVAGGVTCVQLREKEASAREFAAAARELVALLRPLGLWRMVFMPLVLVLLMIFRPRGIMGLRELRWFVPGYDLFAIKRWRAKKEAGHDAAAAD